MSDPDALPRCRRLVAAHLGADGGVRAEDVALYLAHTLCGAPLRRLALQAGRTPSTILRAVRRVEMRRDDPLVDQFLHDLESTAVGADPAAESLSKEAALPKSHPAEAVFPAPPALVSTPPAAGEERVVEKEARRILRRLSEPRAFLALARGAQVACVFRKGEAALVTLARTPLDMARAFAARDWIACVHAGPAMARYEISAMGRSWLKRTLDGDGDARRRAAEGMAEAPSVFARQHQEAAERFIDGPDGPTKLPVNAGETPLGWLAKRRDADGKPFLLPEEVAAGEKLREDFELAQLGPRITQDWRRFLTPGGSGGQPAGPAEGPTAARDRVTQALAALGPGLEDAALRACCFLEGLEATERRMGWSARSGKVVLKIALGRLAEHYGFARAPAARTPPRGATRGAA